MKAKYVIALMMLMFTTIVLADVTDTDTYDWIKYDCDAGTTGFTYNFRVLQASDLVVIHYDTATDTATTLANITDYTVSVTNNDFRNATGGTVTTTSTYGATIDLIISTQFTMTQLAKMTYRWQPATVEDALDKSRLIDRQLYRNMLRCLRGPEEDDPNLDMEYGNAAERASKWLGFGATGAVVLSDSVTPANAIVSVWGETFIDDGDAATARGTIGLDTDDDVEFADITGDDVEFDDITTKGPWVDVRAFGAVADSGTTDNTTAFTNAIATTKNVYVPLVPGEYYKITDEVTIANAGQVIYSNGADVRQATANKAGLIVTASDVEIRGLKIVGTQYAAASSNNEKGIDVYGADKDNYLSGIKITNCKITTFGDYGIHLEFVEDFEVNNNFIDDIWHTGILGLQVRRGKFNDNNVTDIVGTAPAYGIVLSRQADDSLVTYPRSSEITIATNVVTNVTNWEGIDTHGGEHISITGNTVDGCKAGIVATAADEGDDTEEFAPLDISIVGNTISSGVTDGSALDGISFSGAHDGTAQEYATGVISGNMIRGYGLETSSSSGGIAFRTTRGLSVVGNTVIEGSPHGILPRRDNIGFVVSGNVIIDAWSDTVTVYGIRVSNPNCIGYIGGNSFRIGSKSATDVLGIAIRVVDVTTNIITLGTNDSEAAAYLADSATADRCLRGEFNTDFPTTGGGTDDLASTVIPADSLGIGRFLRVTAAGTVTDVNAGDKTIIFKFGSTSINIQAAANTNTDWRFEAVIEYSSAANQRISWVAFNGNTSLQGYDAATEDMTGDVTMEVTGLCADAGDTITQTMWIIERL